MNDAVKRGLGLEDTKKAVNLDSFRERQADREGGAAALPRTLGPERAAVPLHARPREPEPEPAAAAPSHRAALAPAETGEDVRDERSAAVSRWRPVVLQRGVRIGERVRDVNARA